MNKITQSIRATIAALVAVFLCLNARAEIEPCFYSGVNKPVVIFKLDDLRDHTDWVSSKRGLWTDIIDMIQSKSSTSTGTWVANAGAIGEHFDGSDTSFESDVIALGIDEIWNHGQTADSTPYNSGNAAAQTADINSAQANILSALSATPIAFGAPENARNSSTPGVIDDHPDIKVWLFADPNAAAGSDSMHLTRTYNWSDSTETDYSDLDPDVANYSTSKFVSNYNWAVAQGHKVIVYQFHPKNFNSSSITALEAYFDALLSAHADVPVMTMTGYYSMCAGTTPGTPSGSLALYEDFETAADFDFGSEDPYTDSYGGTGSLTSTTEEAYAGSRSLKMTVIKSGTTNYRAELTGKSNFPLGAPFNSRFFTRDIETWVGFAVKPKSNYPYNNKNTVVFQWHQQGYQQQDSDPELEYYYDNPNLVFAINSRKALISWNRVNYECSAPFNIGDWNTVVMHSIHTDTTNGYAEVWVNDVKCLDVSGVRTFYNEGYYSPSDVVWPDESVFWKTGIYEQSYKGGYDRDENNQPLADGTETTLYIDELKILGGVSDGYDSVVPGGSSEPVGSVVSIDSVNGNDEITASSELNTATTSNLTGAFEARIYDADGDEEISDAINNSAGTATYFTTGSLTDIDAQATLEISYAPVELRDFDPTDDPHTAATYVTRTAYGSTVGPFSNCETHTNTNGGSAFARTSEDILTGISASDIITINYYVIAGTDGQIYVGIKNDGSGNDITYAGSLSGSTLGISQDEMGTSKSATVEDMDPYTSDGLKKVTITFTATDTGDYAAGIGATATSASSSIVNCGMEVWVNRAANTVTASRPVSVPAVIPPGNSAPTITSVPDLTNGELVTFSGTNLGSVYSAVIDNGSTELPISDYIPASSGTSAAFTVPEGLAASGNTLKLYWSERNQYDLNMTDAGNNFGGSLCQTNYPTANWVTANGIMLCSDGTRWHRTSDSMIYVFNGDTVTTRFFYKPESSGEVQLNARLSSAGENITLEGVPGSLVMTQQQYGSNVSHSTTQYNNVYITTLQFDVATADQLALGMGTNSDIDDETLGVLGLHSYSDNATGSVTQAVTVASTTEKYFTWSATPSDTRIQDAGDPSGYFNGTLDRCVVFDDMNFYTSMVEAQTPIFTTTNIAFTNGESDTDITSASVTGASLSTLTTGRYYYWQCVIRDTIDLEAISYANPIVFTATSHGLSTSDPMYFYNTLPEINNKRYEITVIDANSFSIDEDGTNYSGFNLNNSPQARGIPSNYSKHMQLMERDL